MSSIRHYSSSAISSFLLNQYNICNPSLSGTRHGLDNSVFVVTAEGGKKFVLKIVETKSKAHIQGAIRQSQKIPKDFCRLDYIPCKSGGVVANYLDGKPAFMYSYRPGEHFYPSDRSKIKTAATFLRKFHDQNRNGFVSGTALSSGFVNEIKLYASSLVLDGLNGEFAQDFKGLAEHICFVKKNERLFHKAAENVTTHRGLTHSDYTPDNILSANGKLELIDCDSVQQEGSQLIDTLQFISKTSLVSNSSKTGYFLKTYYAGGRVGTSTKTVKPLLFLFGLKSILSTLYYSYDISKINTNWIKSNAMYSLRPLYDGVSHLRSNNCGL